MSKGSAIMRNGWRIRFKVCSYDMVYQQHFLLFEPFVRWYPPVNEHRDSNILTLADHSLNSRSLQPPKRCRTFFIENGASLRFHQTYQWNILPFRWMISPAKSQWLRKQCGDFPLPGLTTNEWSLGDGGDVHWPRFLARTIKSIIGNGACLRNHMAVCQNLVPLVNIKIAGKWMFIPLKMVLIGIDPYPYLPSGYD